MDKVEEITAPHRSFVSNMQRAIRSIMRIQYASDIHLEFHGDKTPFPLILKPAAPVLALAGDVGWPGSRIYRDFLGWCSRNWDAVFIVAGNHEFYNCRDCDACVPDVVSARLAAISATAAEFPNVQFLERRRVMYRGVAFLGCTLWSDLSVPVAATNAMMFMNDYRRIATDVGTTGPLRLTPEDTTTWWKRDRAWLDAEIAACEEAGWPAVVITHHLPTHDLIAECYKGSPLNAAFASACDDLIRAPIRAWIAGHTHSAVTRIRRDITMGVNPLGYPGESRNNGYCREIFVDVPTEPGRGGDTRNSLLVAACGERYGV